MTKNDFRRLIVMAVVTASSAFAAVQKDIEYRNIDGRKLTLDASVPEGDGPFPAVIIVHGGGWARGDKRSYVTPLFEPLNNAGFVWFSIDYREVPDSQFPAPEEDVMAAVQWVWTNAQKYKVSLTKVALLGESAGGQLVGYVGARYGKAFGLAAIVDFYGPNDMLVQGLRTKAQREKHEPGSDASSVPEYLGIKTWDDQATAKMKAASPITWVAKGIPPFLCLHGTADTQVPYEQSPNLCAAIKKVGGICEVQTIPNGAHGMSSWKTEWKPQLIDWLRKTLNLN